MKYLGKMMKFESIDRIIIIGFLITLFIIYIIIPSWETALAMLFMGVYIFTRTLSIQEGSYKTIKKSSRSVIIGWSILNIGLLVLFFLEIFVRK